MDVGLVIYGGNGNHGGNFASSLRRRYSPFFWKVWE